MERWQETSESLNGRYFYCTDLIIIREPGFASTIAAVQDMIASGGINHPYSLLPPDDAD
ncbi:hypothetical protein [Nonomuraea sp. NPDC050643]|uniref:hypothetical protein n=1 Tax=Nonomuraea sp. NPDC050643 TaxID=3155660 RepID=UPI0033F8C85C